MKPAKALEQIRKKLPSGLKNETVKEVVSKIAVRHKVNPNHTNTLLNMCARLEDALIALEIGGFRDSIKDLEVLDLACGSRKAGRYNPNNEKRMMEPWLCRQLAYMGANVTGVDIDYPHYKRKKGKEVGQTENTWKFVQRDLMDPDSLDEKTFPSESYDFVLSNAFILNENHRADAPEFIPLNRNNPAEYIRICQGFIRQVNRVLVEGGVFLSNSTVLVKENGIFKFMDHIGNLRSNVALILGDEEAIEIPDPIEREVPLDELLDTLPEDFSVYKQILMPMTLFAQQRRENISRCSIEQIDNEKIMLRFIFRENESIQLSPNQPKRLVSGFGILIKKGFAPEITPFGPNPDA